ncbi:malto-oligosyltrehalose trehalohydrolase [Jatrophihabitans telluris]|uniref:Malto-oligosyltrehalose trehalohydrolase n=1 Tax=Jatrophihabitans telluris TaxID=2038343 RepID=A0ABY4R009_9ACTN|nr:malto-oligosyltrehalose trehalohydrolase [Jatrophihabitans telluris]UQX88611.1 malto-oligosyltrehalose trehalohydrolase [Jatrophihabitans telluris]
MSLVSVWAPRPTSVRLWLDDGSGERTIAMTKGEHGWWSVESDAANAGVDYGFLLDDAERPVADPRSRRQPAGVHGPSRFYPDEFAWTDGEWAGLGLGDAVLYELHIGTFTEAGTFDAAIERLDYLAELGVTHIELLPVNDFNGLWNWGYDGVLWYAVHEAYGGPDGLKRLVDAAHARGLAVVLDVVYNHFGPSGNYLPEFGPYLKSGRNTWGDLVNLDGESSGPVRAYILDNVTQWLSEFHVDALRLDAVHALQDTSEQHLLAQMSERVEHLSREQGRPLTLIAESDLNDPVMFTPRSEGGYGLDGQWDDDVHHMLHALLSGERQGYYDDFGTLPGLAKVLTRAFFHDGTYSTFRKHAHGKPVDRERTPGWRFVVCLQNHDQVGNRAAGDRLPEIATPGLLAVGATLLLTSPFTPMLWMGEEWAASTRWPFFTSHPEPELGEATAKGRVAEFAEHGWDVSQMIDPQDELAFTSAKLRWDEAQADGHSRMLSVYRELLRLRHAEPDLRDGHLLDVQVDFDEQAGWVLIRRGAFLVAVNLADTERAIPLPTEPEDAEPAEARSTAPTVVFSTATALDPTRAAVTASGGVLGLPAESAAILRL